MKEYPESNYFLKISTIDIAFDPQLGMLLPRSYMIQANLIVRIVIVPWLPASPWPPPYPTDWDHWRDRDEAAWYLFATNVVTVAPTEAHEARIQTVIFDEYPDLPNTVFWRPHADYEALLADVERAYDTQDHNSLRLDELAPGPLVEFLRHDLPRASLSAYKREILCLDPPSALSDNGIEEIARGPLAVGVLTAKENTILEYHNRLEEYIRLAERKVHASLLEEHADGLDFWRKMAETAGLGHAGRLHEWTQQYFPEIPALEARCRELGLVLVPKTRRW